MSRFPQFAELKDGDYTKLNEAIENGMISFPAYIYDEDSNRLMHLNKDKTYTYVQGAPTSYVALSGKQDDPINVSSLADNMYIIDGYYNIDGIEETYYSEIPLLFIIGSTGGTQKISCFSSSDMKTYTVTEEETTVSTPITDDNIDDLVVEKVEEVMTPATDQDIDDLFGGD